MNYLGLDYGTVHVGVALALGPLAEPLTTVSTISCFDLLPGLIKKHQVGGLVVGDCSPQFMGLLKSLGLPVFQVDETLTTKDAQKYLFHTSPARRKSLEHAVAAALILQSFLDSQP